MTNPKNGGEPLASDADILALVKYASPQEWGYTREEVLMGAVLLSLNSVAATPVYLLAWPDGVRAMLASTVPPGSPQMDLAVVNTYRAAASGYVGPVIVGE